MNNNLIKLTPEDIYNMEFKKVTIGYQIQDVDKYLDEVIQDYQTFNAIISNLQKENDAQSDEILSLKQEIRELRTELEIAKGQGQVEQVNSLDVLKRLSQLEKIVYGKDE